MMRMRRLALILAAGMLSAPATAYGQGLPTAPIPADLFKPFLPLIGKTFRGTTIGTDKAVDVVRWEWTAAGHAIRATHAVNEGYGGETLIYRDPSSNGLIFHYVTTGGFYTSGTMRTAAPDTIEIAETVHMARGKMQLKSNLQIGPNGTYRTRSFVEKDGKSTVFGGFDYRQDANAKVVLKLSTPPAN